MERKFNTDDYFSKIPSIKGISGVRFFEDKKSLLELLCLPTNINKIDIIKSLMDFDSLFTYFSQKDIVEKFRDSRINKRIKLRIIRKRERSKWIVKDNDKKDLREKRYLPDDFDLSSCFFIFGNYVSIFTLVGKPYGVLIENEYYRKTLDSIFENLWEVSEKPIQ